MYHTKSWKSSVFYTHSTPLFGLAAFQMLDNHTGLAPTMSVSTGLETVHSQLLCPVFIQEAVSRMSCEHTQCPLRVSGLLQ